MTATTPHAPSIRWAFSLYALSYIIQTTFGIYITLYFSTYFRFVLLLSTTQMAIIIGIQVIQICVKVPLSRLILARLWQPRNRRWLQGILGGAGIVVILGCVILRCISSTTKFGLLILAISCIYLGLATADTTVDTVFISLHKQHPIPLALGQQIAGLIGAQVGGLIYRMLIGTDFLTGDWMTVFGVLACVPGLYVIGTLWFSKRFSTHLETMTKNFANLYTTRTFLPKLNLADRERQIMILFGAFLIFSNVGYLVNSAMELLITERFGSGGFTLYTNYVLANYLVTVLCSIAAIFLRKWLLKAKYLIIVLNGIFAMCLFLMYLWSPLLSIGIMTVIYGIIPAFYNIIIIALIIDFSPASGAAIYYQLFALLIAFTRIGLDALGMILSGVWGYPPLFIVTVGCLLIPLGIVIVLWRWEHKQPFEIPFAHA